MAATLDLNHWSYREIFVDLPRFKGELKTFHIHSFAAEANSFQFESCPLLMGGCTLQLYLAASSQHSMPRQLIRWIGPQQPGHRSMETWITSGSGDPAIGAHLAWRDGKNDPAKCNIARLVEAHCGVKQTSPALLYRELVHRKGNFPGLPLRFYLRFHPVALWESLALGVHANMIPFCDERLDQEYRFLCRRDEMRRREGSIDLERTQRFRSVNAAAPRKKTVFILPLE